MNEFDPTDIAAQEAARQAEAEHQAFLYRRSVDDLKFFMQDKRGRRIVYQLLADTGVFRNPFVPGQPDLTAYNAGAMSIGQKLFADVQEHCAKHYETMIEERRDDNRKR